MDPYSQQPSWQTPPPGYPLPQTPYPQSQPGYPGSFSQAAFPGEGQPGYVPLQPGYPGQSPRTPRTRGWVIAFIVLVLLLGGVIATYAIVQAQNSPTATLQQFCDGLLQFDALKIYDTLSAQYQQQSALATIQQGFAQLKSQGGKVESCVVSSVEQENSIASGVLTVVAKSSASAAPQTSTVSVTLIQENGRWKINSISSSFITHRAYQFQFSAVLLGRRCVSSAYSFV